MISRVSWSSSTISMVDMAVPLILQQLAGSDPPRPSSPADPTAPSESAATPKKREISKNIRVSDRPLLFPNHRIDKELLSGAKNGKLHIHAAIPPIIEAGSSPDEPLIDLLHRPHRWVGHRPEVWRIWAIVAIQDAVILITLRWHPTRIADQSAYFALIQAIGRPRRADDVLLHHHRPHIVRAEEHGQLPDLRAHGHPATLKRWDVVQEKPGNGQHPQVFLRPRHPHHPATEDVFIGRFIISPVNRRIPFVGPTQWRVLPLERPVNEGRVRTRVQGSGIRVQVRFGEHS